MSEETPYPHLFSPFRLAGRPLRNRIVHAAMSTRFAVDQRVKRSADRLLCEPGARRRRHRRHRIDDDAVARRCAGKNQRPRRRRRGRPRALGGGCGGGGGVAARPGAGCRPRLVSGRAQRRRDRRLGSARRHQLDGAARAHHRRGGARDRGIRRLRPHPAQCGFRRCGDIRRPLPHLPPVPRQPIEPPQRSLRRRPRRPRHVADRDDGRDPRRLRPRLHHRREAAGGGWPARRHRSGGGGRDHPPGRHAGADRLCHLVLGHAGADALLAPARSPTVRARLMSRRSPRLPPPRRVSRSARSGLSPIRTRASASYAMDLPIS